MFNRLRGLRPDEKIRAKLLNRLRNTSNSELLRWTDNILTGIGKDLREIQSSLGQQNPEQARVYIEDTRTGALSLLAAMHVMEERINQN